MKTHTSKKAVLLRSLLLLPLLAVLFLSFSETSFIEVEQESNNDHEQVIKSLNNALGVTDEISANASYEEVLLISETIEVHITRAGQILVKDQAIAIENAFEVISRYNSDLSKEEKSQIVSATIHVEEGAPQKTIDRIEEILIANGTATINIAEVNDPKDLERVWVIIDNKNEIWVKNKIVSLDDLSAKLADISSSQGLEDKLKIQIYSEGILHQNFLNKISKEIKKIGASSIQVFTEEYIMPENEFKNNINSTPGVVILKANKMTLEKETEPIIVNINKQGQILVGEKIVALKNLKEFILKTNSNNRGQQKTENVKVNVYVNVGSSEQILYKVTEALSEFGIVNIHPTGHLYQGQEKTTKEIVIHINKNGKLLVQDELVPLKDLNNYLSKINSHLTKEQRSHIINSKINIVPKSPENIIDKVYDILYNYGSATIDIRHLKDRKYAILEGNANSKQITEYNALAKKYNTMLKKSRSIQIKKKDVERLEYIYGLMSKKQKAAAEPFPDFPELPPVPNAPKAPNEREEAANIIKGIIEEQDPYDNVHATLYSPANKKDFTVIQESPSAPRVLKGEASNIPKPPRTNQSAIGKIPPYDCPQEGGDYSKELLDAFDKFQKIGHSYGKVVTAYKEKGQGDIKSLQKMYKNVIKDLDKYNKFAIEENVIGSSPIFAPKVKKGEKSDIPKPPKEPKAPKALKGKVNKQEKYGADNVRVYQHNVGESKTASPNLMKSIESLVKRDAQFYFEGKKVSTKEGLRIVKSKKNILIETHPYVNKKPEVRIHTNPNDVSIPKPPTPPEPVSPLDHVIDMAKKNAIFYLEGKEITSDKAIEVMKKNKDINIDSRSANGKRPVVKMSTKPIRIN